MVIMVMVYIKLRERPARDGGVVQQVVSMDYIKTCQIAIIKFHRSIVGQIHLRQENQLFIRSLMGGLYRSDVQFFAEGIDAFEEWQTLQILGVSAGGAG